MLESPHHLPYISMCFCSRALDTDQEPLTNHTNKLVRPTRYVHLVPCFGTREVLTSVSFYLQPTTPQFKKLRRKTKANPCMPPQAGIAKWKKCLWFLLRDVHKGSLNFHPRGEKKRDVTGPLNLLNASATGQVMRRLFCRRRIN